MTVTVEYAAKHFEELLDAVDGGSSVEILRPDKPALRLSSEISEAHPDETDGDRILGAGRGLLRVPSDQEWDDMDREWRKSFAAKFELGEEC